MKRFLTGIVLLLIVSPIMAQDTATPVPKRITAMLWSSDGRALAVQTSVGIYLYQSTTPYIPDVETSPLIIDGNEFGRIIFSPDSKWLVYSRSEIQLWDVATRQLVRTIQSPTGQGAIITFNHSGSILVANATGDGCECFIDLWDISDVRQNIHLIYTLKGHAVGTFGIMDSVFSADEKMLASIDSSGITRLWDLNTGGQISILRGYGSYSGASVQFSKAGDNLITNNLSPGNDGYGLVSTVSIWDLNKVYSNHTLEDTTEAIIAQYTHAGSAGYALSYINSQMALDSGEGYIQLINLKTGEEITRIRSSAFIKLAFTEDDSRFYAVDRDRNIWIWDITDAISYGMDRQALPITIVKTQVEAQEYIPAFRLILPFPEPDALGLGDFE
jgi:WD40 repeat protein